MYSTYETYDANSARSYSMLGGIFVGLAALGGLITIIGATVASSWLPHNWWWGPWGPNQVIAVLAILILALLFIFDIIFVSLAYITHKRIEEGNYSSARSTALILGIFGLFPLFGFFFGGIFYLLTYGKLGAILKTQQARVFTPGASPTANPAPVPVATPKPTSAASPASTSKARRFCPSCGQVVSNGDRFCLLCGAKLPQT